MASSPEQRDIERKERDLKLQEDRLTRRVEQQQKQEDKLSQNQEKITEREQKAIEADRALKEREDQLSKQLKQLEGDQGLHIDERASFDQGRKRRLAFMMPVLLLAGVGAGYLTYDYYAKNDIYSQRLSLANENVSKLSDILIKAEDQKTAVLQKLSLKEDELTRKTKELSTLKTAYARLEKEKKNSDGSRSELEGNKKSLEESVAALTQEKSALEQSVKQLDDALARNKAELATLAAESKLLATQLLETEAGFTELKTHDANLAIELEEKSGVLIAAKQAIDERDKIIEAKVKRQSALELELATLQEQHQLLTDSRDTLAKALDDVKLSAEKLNSDLAANQAGVSEIDAKYQQQQLVLSELEAKLKSTEEDLSAEQQKRADLEKKLVDSQREVSTQPATP